jgi:hypothetical protein
MVTGAGWNHLDHLVGRRQRPAVGLQTHESRPARRHGAQPQYGPQGITKRVGDKFGFVRRLTKGDVGPFSKFI